MAKKIINGTESSEIINGTTADEIINGLGGNDTIHAYGGNDELFGGEGDDKLDDGSAPHTRCVLLVRGTLPYHLEQPCNGTARPKGVGRQGAVADSR